MAWVKLDEDFATHPKVLEAGPLGMAMQVAALCYCNRHLTDGHISLSAVRTLLDLDGLAFTLGSSGEDATADRIADDLVAAGLWHERDHDCPDCPPVSRGFILHGYLEMQPSKSDVEAKRAQASEAGRRGGLAKAKRTAKRDAKRNASEPLSGSPSETPSGSLAKVCPDPDTGNTPLTPLADAKGESPDPAKRARRAPKFPLPGDWAPNDAHQAKARDAGLSLATEADQFRNHHLARDSRFADWDRAFHTWLTNAVKWQRPSERPVEPEWAH